MLQRQKPEVSQGGWDAPTNWTWRGYVKSTNILQGSSTNKKRGENRRVSAPYPQDTLHKEKHTALFIQKYSFQHAPLRYPLSAQNQQGTGDSFNKQHEQEIQRCGARSKAQMVQALLYLTGGHSMGLYASFIKLYPNWCSHPDSRNHHTSFLFKRGNKRLICKAFCTSGSQTAAQPTDGHRRRKVQRFAQNALSFSDPTPPPPRCTQLSQSPTHYS